MTASRKTVTTMGISLRDCADPDIGRLCDNIYQKITRTAKHLVKTGQDIAPPVFTVCAFS